MQLKTIEFPSTVPAGVEGLEDEPDFVPSRHLQLESSRETHTLEEFGYSNEVISQCPGGIAVAGPFRVLSEEGAAVLLETSRRLQAFKSRSERIAAMVRFPAYRSTFIRELARSAEVAKFVSEQLGADMVPHSLTGLALAHLNYAPDNLDEPVDHWHHDIVGVDYVMAVTDPTHLDGGKFEFFRGTKDEAACFMKAGKGLPKDRVSAVDYPAAGWAIVQQGNMVVHRATRLRKLTERTSMVVSYVAADFDLPETTVIRDYSTMDPAHVIYPEWARHKAWIARAKIDRLLASLPFTHDRELLVAALEDVRGELDVAIEDIRDESQSFLHRYAAE